MSEVEVIRKAIEDFKELRGYEPKHLFIGSKYIRPVFDLTLKLKRVEASIHEMGVQADFDGLTIHEVLHEPNFLMVA